MENIENFFNRKIFFTKEEESFNSEDEYYIKLNAVYKSQTLHFPNITLEELLIKKIRPYLKYLVSYYLERITHVNYWFTFFEYISYYDGNNNLKNKMIAYMIKREGGDDLRYVTLNNDNDNKILNNPFKICNKINSEFLISEFPENYEYDNEPIHRDPPPKPLKSFKTDTCVICLTKEPNVLFTDCRHICICLECEEIKPLSKCTYCKVTISTKIIV